MKRFISGVLVGALLFGGTTALADSVKNLVGAKVTGVYTIEQGSKKIADAAIINGSAHVPIRALAEATGIPLTVKGKTITLPEKTMINEGNSVSEDILEKMNQITKLKNEILTNQNNISAEKGNLKRFEEAIAVDEAREEKIPGYQDGVRANIEKCRERIAGHQAQITAAEAEIARIQAEIDASK